MALGIIWAGMVIISVVFASATGTSRAVSTAAMDGAAEAVKLCLSIGGMICLWSGIMEVMRRSGILGALSKLLRPLLRLIYKDASSEALEDLSANLSANLLGLGNAATPSGIRAAKALHRQSGSEEKASDSLCRLVVMNSASVQLIPTTIAAVRAAAGAENAFDILPAVWISSLISVSVGLLVLRLLPKSRI